MSLSFWFSFWFSFSTTTTTTTTKTKTKTSNGIFVFVYLAALALFVDRRRMTLLPHEKLIAYQVARELVVAVRNAAIRDMNLRDQALRSASSVCLNIAEAAGRLSRVDQRRIHAIARGEACEVAAALDVAGAAGHCSEAAASSARELAGRTYALLTGLIRQESRN